MDSSNAAAAAPPRQVPQIPLRRLRFQYCAFSIILLLVNGGFQSGKAVICVQAGAYPLMVFNLVVQDDPVGFVRGQPGQAERVGGGSHQVDGGHGRGR